MWDGVGKSGSPAPNPTTSSPAARSALALASTASVADGLTAATRAEMPLAPDPSTRSVPCSRTDAMAAMLAQVTPATDTPKTPDIRIPESLKPADGRFGCGPSKVRPEQVAALSARAADYLGTSHRQSTVRSVVGRLRQGLGELLSLPEGYEVVLGNGGTTVFWDIATFGLVESQSQHLAFGEFSSKFAQAVRAAPHLDEPQVVESAPGTHPEARFDDSVDLYALTHNETSTGVMMEIRRPGGGAGSALVAVDATSGAGGLRVDPSQFDVYYFAPQKCFASDGGLWVAAMSPAAIDRVDAIAGGGRWAPASLDLGIAIENSRLDQTYNTPSLATLILSVWQLEWILENGGLEFSAGRCDRSAEVLYGWAESTAYASPFV